MALRNRTPMVNVLPAALAPPKSDGFMNSGGSWAIVLNIGVTDSFINNPGTTINS